MCVIVVCVCFCAAEQLENQAKMFETNIRVMKSELQRLQFEQKSTNEKIKENAASAPSANGPCQIAYPTTATDSAQSRIVAFVAIGGVMAS